MRILKIRKNLLILICLCCFVLWLLINSLFRHSTGSSSFRIKNKCHLLFLILSSPENFEKRQAIRDTWLKHVKGDNKYFFVLGNASMPEGFRKKMKEERLMHGDVVTLSIADGYRSLTTKVLLSLQYATHNYEFEYLAKVDDDTWVDVLRVNQELVYLAHPLLYWGYFSGQAHVFTKGTWKETGWYLCDRYLPYALGGGYILAQKLVKYIADNADILRKYSSEDVSVGAWLAGVRTKRVHDIRFDTQAVSRTCVGHMLVRHKLPPSDMFAATQAGSGRCPPVGESPRPVPAWAARPYSYDWAKLPSQCCRHVDPLSPSTPVLYIAPDEGPT